MAKKAKWRSNGGGEKACVAMAAWRKHNESSGDQQWRTSAWRIISINDA